MINRNAVNEKLPESLGSLILEILFDLESSIKKDTMKIFYASNILSLLLNQNEQSKQHLCQFGNNFEEPFDFLQNLILNLVKLNESDVQINSFIGYLGLLIVIIFDSPKSINLVLRNGLLLQFLIEKITQSTNSSIEIQGLSSFILGFLILFNDDSIESFSRYH
jgi:hypothetical protein